MPRSTAVRSVAPDPVLADPEPGAPIPAVTVARAFVEAVTTLDFDRLADLLTDDVWYRALQTHETVEHHDAASVVAAYRETFGSAVAITALETAHHTMQGREHVRYRFRVRPDWAPDTWHVIEQTGYLRVADGRIRRLDVVCTGYHPVT
jgi:hypothetical protein